MPRIYDKMLFVPFCSSEGLKERDPAPIQWNDTGIPSIDHQNRRGHTRGIVE